MTHLSQLVDALLHNTVALSCRVPHGVDALRDDRADAVAGVFRGLDRIDSFYIALAGSLVGLWMALPWTQPQSLLVDGHVVRHELFTGMLVYDAFTLYFRGLLMFFAVLFVVLTRLSGIPDREDAAIFTRWCSARSSACASWPRPIIC